MKRILCTLCALALLFSLCACGKKAVNFYPTPEDVTIESLKERTTPQTLMGFEGGVQVDFRNEDVVNAGAYASTTSFRYRYDGEKVQIVQSVDFDNGEYTHIYFTSDLTEPYMFIVDDREEEIQVSPLTDRETQNALYNSMFFSDDYNYEFTERSKSADGTYRICYDVMDPTLEADYQTAQHVEMDVDPVQGMVKHADIYYFNYGTEAGMSSVDITYNRNIRIDDSPRTEAIAQGLYDPEQVKAQIAQAQAQAQSQSDDSQSGGFNFACTDLDGTLRTMKDYADSALVLISFWEPESEECVNELAELQKLYSDYADTVTVLGAYTSGDEDAVRKAVKEAGATFPILRCDNRLSLYRNEPLPNAILVTGLGELLTEEPFFGVISYNDWESAISSIQEAAASAETVEE